jgi:hypothetical protein
LALGTPLDNVNDSVSAGRHTHGTRHPCAKLTEAQVLEIRASTETQKALAKRFGVSQPVVHHAKHGLTWKHLPLTPGE